MLGESRANDDAARKQPITECCVRVERIRVPVETDIEDSGVRWDMR